MALAKDPTAPTPKDFFEIWDGKLPLSLLSLFFLSSGQAITQREGEPSFGVFVFSRVHVRLFARIMFCCNISYIFIALNFVLLFGAVSLLF